MVYGREDGSSLIGQESTYWEELGELNWREQEGREYLNNVAEYLSYLYHMMIGERWIGPGGTQSGGTVRQVTAHGFLFCQ